MWMGVAHWAVGDRTVDHDPDTRILWTACKRTDVPANAAWYRQDDDIIGVGTI